MKNVIITTADKRIRVLSDTFSGHIHDKTGATDHGIFSPIPNEVLVHID